MDWLDWTALISIVISYVAVIVFIIINHWKIDWRHNPWGRHVMRFSYTYVGLLSLALASRFFGQYPGRKVAITIFYVVLAGVLCERVWLTVREIHKRRVRS